MVRSLTVKTDASYKPGVGFTVAYEAEMFIAGKPTHEFSDSKFINRTSKSTDAEVFAVAYGIVETYKYMQGNVEGYNLFLNSDCEHAVRIYNGDKKKIHDKLHQTVGQFLDDFYSWRINWISRDTNEKANALAKEQLRRAEDNQ